MSLGGSVSKSQENRSCSSIKLLFAKKINPHIFDVFQKIHGFINIRQDLQGNVKYPWVSVTFQIIETVFLRLDSSAAKTIRWLSRVSSVPERI